MMKTCVRPANIASVAMLVALAETFTGSAPDWAIWLVPFWMIILCYLNLELIYAFVANSESVRANRDKSGERISKVTIRRTNARPSGRNCRGLRRLESP